MSILAKICDDKREHIRDAKDRVSLSAIEAAAKAAPWVLASPRPRC